MNSDGSWVIVALPAAIATDPITSTPGSLGAGAPPSAVSTTVSPNTIVGSSPTRAASRSWLAERSNTWNVPSAASVSGVSSSSRSGEPSAAMATPGVTTTAPAAVVMIRNPAPMRPTPTISRSASEAPSALSWRWLRCSAVTRRPSTKFALVSVMGAPSPVQRVPLTRSRHLGGNPPGIEEIPAQNGK